MHIVESHANQFTTAVRKVVSDPDSQALITAAMRFMITIHAVTPPRPEGVLYAVHPLRVALTVIRELKVGNPDVIIAALLHDTVEDEPERVLEILVGKPDPDLSEEEIRSLALEALASKFGDRAAELVEMLSNPILPASATQEDRERAYQDHVRPLFAGDPDGAVIKVADFTQNAFHLDRLPDGDERKNRLRVKYCPVMRFLEELLNSLEDRSHPFFGYRDVLLTSLHEVIARECEDASA